MIGICGPMKFMTKDTEGCGLKSCFECHSWIPEVSKPELLIWVQTQPPYDGEKEEDF